MKRDYNFAIQLFQINRNYEMCEFSIYILATCIGESERSLFSFFSGYSKTEIDLLFIHFRF